MRTVLYPVNELKIGGAEQQLLELVRGLDKRRFHPIVAPLYPGGALEREFRALPDVELLQLHRAGKYDPSPLWRVGQVLRSRQVDVIQPFLTPATFFGLLPSLALGTPLKVVTERCGVRRTRQVGYRIYRTVEDWLTKYADVVVANSAAGRNLLMQRGILDEKIRVVYNGINRERLQPDWVNVAVQRRRLGVPEPGFVVGMLASLTPAKGHDVFLRAAARVAGRRSDVRWAIVGDGPLRSELEEAVSALGLSDRVVFFGNQRRIADYLASCDLLVSASRDNEGCSNSILEAMGLGIPVIATNVGGNCELVEHDRTGYLVPVGDDVALAEAIEGALDNASDTREVAANGHRMVEERFGLERMVAQYETLYTELLERREHRLLPPYPPTPLTRRS